MDTPLTEREFVLRAIQILPERNAGHLGVNPAEINSLFKQRFGTEATETINAMIAEGSLILTRLEHNGKAYRHHGSRLTRVEFLGALPVEGKVSGGRLRLYLSGVLPFRIMEAKRIKKKRERLLAKINES